MKKTMALLAVVFAALLAAAAWAKPVTVTDLAGRQVTLEAPARRVVLTFYFEEYFAVTGEDGIASLAGWSRRYWEKRRQSSWNAFAAKFPQIGKIPDVGYIPNNSFNLESVIALMPDVVFISKNDFRKTGQEVKRLESLGIPVVVVDYHDQTVENHVNSTLLFGRVMGKEERAREVAEWYKAQVLPLFERAAALKDRPRVYMEFSGDPAGPKAFGGTWGKLMWGGIVHRVGGDNIARELVQGADGVIAPEQVLAADPEVVIFAGNYRSEAAENVGLGYEAKPERAREQLEGYCRRTGWEGLSAVKHRRMGALYHDLSRHIFDAAGIQFIAKLLHPEVFADLDPQKTLQDFYDRFFPVPLTGTFFVTL